MMKRTIHIAIGTCLVAACAGAASAQPPAGDGPGGRRGGAPAGDLRGAAGRLTQGVRGGGPGGPMFGTVPGAPFSAEGVTTVTQTLADGTRIDRTVRAKMFRDSEGRVRREETILGLAPLNATGESQMVTITDPVAGVVYNLDVANRTARKMTVPAGGRGRGMPPPPPPAGSTDAGAPPPPPPPDWTQARGRNGGPGPGVPGGRGTPGARGRAGAGALVTEDLGTRVIEGVTATGRRQTITIEAGRIGNDRPIEMTDEMWTSPDLKVLVMSKHHDPRSGDVEFRLTNIVRGDQPRELFTPPPDYTITEPGGRGRGRP